MQFGDMLPNYFTLNGKSYPATETVKAKVGDRILFRLIGSGQFIHPIHIHGGPFQIVATDGNPVPEGVRLTKDIVLVGPGERYDVVWTAQNPGSGCSIATSTITSPTMTITSPTMVARLTVAAA
jgi:FtsP/CotA-like multicopper oxidase with cupredoxin domain